MEKTMSQEERIRRAEEIYNRRNYNRGYGRTNNREVRLDYKRGKRKIANKMLIQMIVCLIIYIVMLIFSDTNGVLSNDIKNKTNEILSYDISFENLKASISTYYNNVKEKMNSFNNKNEQEQIESNTEQTNEESQNMEKSQNTENQNLEEQQNTENSQDTIADVDNQAMGGSDEENTQVAEEKSQEELDIEYIKQNLNIIWPLNGVITSKYGPRTPTKIVSANHKGLDIAGNTGSSIIAAADGIVTLASTEGDYGNHLKIENGEITTLYAHCSKLLVSEGMEVKQGDAIAEVGSTGRATGPHLHFEIRRENRYVDPQEILP